MGGNQPWFYLPRRMAATVSQGESVMRHLSFWNGLAASLILAVGLATSRADEPQAPSKEELIKNLEKTLTGAKLTGRFTVKGKADMTPAPEEYTISSARKL